MSRLNKNLKYRVLIILVSGIVLLLWWFWPEPEMVREARRSMRRDGADVTSIVLKYIPSGSAAEHAEEVLNPNSFRAHFPARTVGGEDRANPDMILAFRSMNPIREMTGFYNEFRVIIYLTDRRVSGLEAEIYFQGI